MKELLLGLWIIFFIAFVFTFIEWLYHSITSSIVSNFEKISLIILRMNIMAVLVCLTGLLYVLG